MTLPSRNLVIYTDGACEPNPGPGGWGCVFYWPDGRTEVLRGRCDMTTNNRMEMTAILEAMLHVPEDMPATILSDSRYCIDGITSWVWKWQRNGWKRGQEPVKNVEIWKQMVSAMRGKQIAFKWVRGHSGIEGNEIADRLAGADLSWKPPYKFVQKVARRDVVAPPPFVMPEAPPLPF